MTKQIKWTALKIFQKPFTGIRPEHLETVIRGLRMHHEDTGELPSASGYIDLVQRTVESTPA